MDWQASSGKTGAGTTEFRFSLRLGHFGDTFEGADKLPETGSVSTALSGLQVRHHLSDVSSLSLSVPIGYVRLDPDGGSGGAREQRQTGFGDTEVGGSYALRPGIGFATRIELETALALPSGQSRLSSTAGGAEAPPNLLSIGRGAFGVRAAAHVRRFVHRRVAFGGTLGVSRPIGANGANIVFGTVAQGGGGVIVQATGALWLGAMLQLQYATQARSTANGTLLNSGGTWLFGQLTASTPLGDHWQAGAFAQIPLYRDVEGTQIAETVSGGAFVSVTFGGDDEEHDHSSHDHGDGEEGHDHGNSHAEEVHAHQGHAIDGENHQVGTTADVTSLATGGDSFVLADSLVSGKYTVIDFWAEWCKPCGPLRDELHAIAARRPDVAVRMVEVPSFESPVAKEHLSDALGLPVVWVYGPDGRKIASFDTQALEGVRKLFASLP